MEREKYIYWQDDDMWLGYLEEYPDYMTQGKTIEELEENLRDIYTERNIVMRGEFTTVIEKCGEWYIGYLEEISGVNTQGKSVEEVKENLKEALSLIIEANRELTRKSTEGHDVIRGTIAVEV